MIHATFPTDGILSPMITIGSLVIDAPTFSPHESVARVRLVMSNRSPLTSAVIVAGKLPVGLVMSHHLNQMLSLQYGQSLFLKKPISSLMDATPMIVKNDLNLENVAALAMQRKEENIYDNIIVTDQRGVLDGVVPVHAIISKMAALEKVRAKALEAGNRFLEQEIQDKQRIQRDLIDSQSKLQLVIDTIPQSIYWKNKELAYVGINKNFLRDAGVKHESELIGKTDLERVPVSEEAKFAHENDRRVIDSGLADLYAIEPRIKANGERLFFNVNRIPLFDSKKQVDGLLVTYEDITEKVLGKQEKAELESKLRKAEKMEAIGTLAGGIAHDLNNILSGVISYPQLLLLDLPKESPLHRPLTTIQQAGERAAAIVHDLLTMARRAVETMTPVNLNQILDDYFQSPELSFLKANHPNVGLSRDVSGPVLTILGVPHQVSKLIMNLVSNAVEAINSSGEVSVCMRLRNLTEPRSGYEDIPSGQYAVIDVSDSGTGIDTKDLERIFEPFYTKKNMGRSGTGLGLAVVWGIVKDHRGFIDIHTRKAQGTTFSLYFPLTDQKGDTNSPKARLENFMGHGESILAVDDVAEQRQIASIMLKKLGYSVTTVRSGEEALLLTRKNAFDVILLDMIMDPGIDGLETYRQILKNRPGQKAIIVSGYSETRWVQQALNLGASAYIKKPYSIEKIGVAIGHAVNQREYIRLDTTASLAEHTLS